MNKKTVLRCGTAVLLSLVALSAVWMGAGSQQASAASLTHTAGSTSVISSMRRATGADALTYWTTARMKSARSIDMRLQKQTPIPSSPRAHGSPVSRPPVPRGKVSGKPALNGHIAPDAGTVPYPYPYPYSTVGKVFFTDPMTGNDFVCSGTAVVSNNRSTVDTAGHCVANGGNGYFYTNWVFCAQYLDGCPDGDMWTARQLWTSSRWFNDAWFTYDYGEAVLNPNNSGFVTDVIGSAGWAYNQPYLQTYTALGYPAAPPFDGTRLWECVSFFVSFDQPNPGPTALGINCDMTGGSSGGGWLVTLNGTFGYVNGHNDYKHNGDPAHMYSPYYGDDWFTVYNAAQNS